MRPLHGSRVGSQQKGQARNGSLELSAPPAPYPVGGEGLELMRVCHAESEAAMKFLSCEIQGPSRNTWGCWDVAYRWGLGAPSSSRLHMSSLAACLCVPPTSVSPSSKSPNPNRGSWEPSI